MAVLAHFGDEDAGTTPRAFGEVIRHLADFLHQRILTIGLSVHAGNEFDWCFMTPEVFFQGGGDFTQGGAGLGRLDGKVKEIAFPRAGAFGQGFQRGFARGGVPFRAQFLQAGDLGFPDGGVVHFQNIDLGFLFQAVFVNADDGFLSGVNGGLAARCGFFNAHLGQPGFNGLGHASEFFHFLKVGPALADELIGQVFHIVGAAPRVDYLADGGFILKMKLGVAGDAGGKVRRQGNRFVQGVRVQGLRMAAGGGQGLNTGAGDVVERVLFREGPAGSLGVRAQGQ